MTENAEQQEAIKSLEEIILVLAGAGSGKTKTLIDKIKFHINEKKIAPKNILAITFTRDAISEIQDRLIEYADKTNRYKAEIKSGNQDTIRKEYINQNAVLKNLTVRTFHSLCYLILKENGAPYYDSRFRLLQDKRESFRMDDSFNISPSTESIDSLLRKSIISACQDDPIFFQKLELYLIENYFEKQAKDLYDGKIYDNKKYRCFNGAFVRSKSEQKIIDWFYSKGYEVEYEPLAAIAVKDPSVTGLQLGRLYGRSLADDPMNYCIQFCSRLFYKTDQFFEFGVCSLVVDNIT